ncbi:carbohydrate porin, partial [Klebsiella pneumoniae]|uniref:carbohydrate porin n=1 Tax=Klebsiella pneumoniae TaxID=573 RepID=UPI003464A5B0
EWVHVQLHQQKGMISLSPPTICNSAYKITLAQQWQAGNSVWSRPAIRIFATYAKWDENWGYSNTSGLQTKDSSGSGAFTSSRGDDSEVTFGAQMEVWW